MLKIILDKMKNSLREKKDYLMVLLVGKVYHLLAELEDRNCFYSRYLAHFS